MKYDDIDEEIIEEYQQAERQALFDSIWEKERERINAETRKDEEE